MSEELETPVPAEPEQSQLLEGQEGNVEVLSEALYNFFAPVVHKIDGFSIRISKSMLTGQDMYTLCRRVK